jgi:hypothetical protein
MRDTYLSRIRVNRAFVSYTDASAFLQRGVPALHLEGANMWHADQVWGRYTDTLERLDERDMLECRRLIEQVVKQLDAKGERRRSSGREPADSLRDISNVIGGWLPSLTLRSAHEDSF